MESTITANLIKMEKSYAYGTKLEVRFPHLQITDIASIVDNCTDKWYNETLTRVNDSVVRIGIVEGEYHWLKHDRDDEFFFVLEGELLIDFENRVVELNPNQGFTIPKGVVHRTKALQKTVMLVLETSAIQPTGD